MAYLVSIDLAILLASTISVLIMKCSTCFLGLLTRRPEEEVNAYGGNLLKELMKSMAKALWPADVPPEGMAELASRFKGAR